MGALFGFGYHAVVAAVPALVTLWSVRQGVGESSLAWVTAVFGGGMVVGRVVLLLLWRGDRPLRKESVFMTLVLGASVLLVLPLVPVTAGSAAAAAALVGLAFGPVYPWVLGVAVRGMDENERLGGVGILVAFGNTGTAAGLFVTGLVAHSGRPFALCVVVVSVFAGMLACWNSLPDGQERARPAAVSMT